MQNLGLKLHTEICDQILHVLSFHSSNTMLITLFTGHIFLNSCLISVLEKEKKIKNIQLMICVKFFHTCTAPEMHSNAV